MITARYMIFVMIFVCVCVLSAHADKIKNEGYSDTEFLIQTQELLLHGAEQAVKVCMMNVLVKDYAMLAGINTSQMNCATRSGIAEISVGWLQGVRFYVELSGGVPVAAIFINQWGVKHTVRFSVSGVSILQSEDNAGNRIVYDYRSRRFLDAHLPVLAITAKQVMINNGVGLEVARNELITALSEYYNFLISTYQQINQKLSVDSFINAIMTRDDERKLFLHFLVARKFYNYTKIDTRLLPWVMGFTLLDFYTASKVMYTKFQYNFQYKGMHISVSRDLQKKTETINVNRAMLTYRLDEKSITVLETNFANRQKVQSDIEKFDTTQNLPKQIVDYMSQYAT